MKLHLLLALLGSTWCLAENPTQPVTRINRIAPALGLPKTEIDGGLYFKNAADRVAFAAELGAGGVTSLNGVGGALTLSTFTGYGFTGQQTLALGTGNFFNVNGDATTFTLDTGFYVLAPVANFSGDVTVSGLLSVAAFSLAIDAATGDYISLSANAISGGSGVETWSIDSSGGTAIFQSVTVIGGLSGALTGNVIGNLTGNADTATALATGRTFAFSGDGTGTSGTFTGAANATLPLTVTKINGTSLAGLATGILKNTTATGVPSIAIGGTDYLTPSGNGSALTALTAANITASTAVGRNILNVTDGTASSYVLQTNGAGAPSFSTRFRNAVFFGDGSDGALASGFGTVTMTRDMFYSSVTFGAGDTITTNGYKLFVNGVLNMSAATAGAI